MSEKKVRKGKKIVESVEKHVDQSANGKAGPKEHKGQDSIQIGYVNGGGSGGTSGT